jgi:hypothetical protein
MKNLILCIGFVSILGFSQAKPMTSQAFHYNLALYTINQLGTVPTQCDSFAAQDPNVEWMCAQFNWGYETFIPNWDAVIASGIVQGSYNIVPTSDWQAYYVPNGLLGYYARTYSFHGGMLMVAYAPFAFYREIHIGFHGVPTMAIPAPQPTSAPAQVQQQVSTPQPAPVQQQAPRQRPAPAQQTAPTATPAPPAPAPQPAPEPPRATPVPQAAPAASLRYDPFGPDRDCGEFATQREAQAFFEAAGGPANDRHRLDNNNDGVACESRP